MADNIIGCIMLEHITVEPQSPAQKAIIWLHGLGADGHDFEPLVPQLALPNTRFIFPHAPARAITINGGFKMRAWFDIHGLDIDSRIDWAGLAQSEQEIIGLIEEQVNKGIDYQNIYLAGFSQGGVVAIYTGLRFKHQLAGIIGLSTFLPVQHPLDCHTANKTTPFFIAHGNKDDIVPLPMGQLVAGWLETQGYPVNWHSYAMAHQVCPEEINDLKHWLK